MYCDDCVEVLYIYDVREMWLDWHAEWDQERKDRYLEGEDDVKPLSADGYWTSITYASIPEFNARRLYSNLKLLKTVLGEECQEIKSSWLIAITRIEERGSGLWIDDQINPDWQLLGYDICAGPSFLMNAGWGDDERELRDSLRPLLNQYHLFSDLDTAKANWQKTHDREPSHGPFMINGLYLVEEINPEKK